MNSLAIIAALPREIAPLTQGLKPDADLRARGIWLYRLDGAVVVAGGMGQSRAALSVEAALAVEPNAELVSVGLAGACTSAVAVGTVVDAVLTIDERTGERFAANPSMQGVTLVTTGEIASIKEKARLAASYGATVVDMEAATVARLARARGLEFRAVKAVSDAWDFELAGLARFTGHQGSFRTGAFAAYTAVRPGRWAQTVALGRNSGIAIMALNQRLAEMIDVVPKA